MTTKGSKNQASARFLVFGASDITSTTASLTRLATGACFVNQEYAIWLRTVMARNLESKILLVWTLHAGKTQSQIVLGMLGLTDL